jgi:hypothetical protein
MEAAAAAGGFDDVHAVSPELALVSPELAEAARLRLPDRPWEAAIHAARTSRERGPTSLTARPLRIRLDGAAVAAASSAGPERPHLEPLDTENMRQLAAKALVLAEAQAHSRRRRRLMQLALAVLLTAGVLRAVQSTPWKAAPEAETITKPPVVAPVTPTAEDSPLLPNAGYVVSPGGSFSTDSSGRAIASFTLPIRCRARSVVVRGVPVHGKTFRFAGPALGRRANVRLRGRVPDRQHVTGTVVARGEGCTGRRVAFVARLS